MTSVDRIQGLSGSLAIKTPCRVATTAAITLSGEQTIDGVAVVEGDRVLVKDQGTTTENGIYDVSTGSWSRSLDFDGVNDVRDGTLVLVGAGATNAELMFKLDGGDPITPGTTAITFSVSAVFENISAFAATLLDDANAAAARTTLGLAIGSDVQGYDADIPTTAASQAEMEAGTEAALRSMSPLRVAQAIAALGGSATTRTTFTASGNLTIPAGVTQVLVTGQAAGGGGGGSTAGGNGGNLTFGKNGDAVSLTLTGGTGGGAYSGGTPGTAGAGGGSGLTQGESGEPGQDKTDIGGGVNPASYANAIGGKGGAGMFGNLGGGGRGSDGTGLSGAAAGGGGAGEQTFRQAITVTSGQWDVTIGAVGTAGTTSGAGNASAVGKGGFFIVEYLA